MFLTFCFFQIQLAYKIIINVRKCVLCGQVVQHLLQSVQFFGLMAPIGTLLSISSSSTLFTKFNFLLTATLSCGFLSRDHNMKFCSYPPLMLIAFFLCLQEFMHANIVPNDCPGLNHRMIVYSWPSNNLINMHCLHSLTSFYIQKLPFQSIYIRQLTRRSLRKTMFPSFLCRYFLHFPKQTWRVSFSIRV